MHSQSSIRRQANICCHGYLVAMVTTNVFKTHQKCQIIAIYVTIGTININITLSFVLHIGRDISAYEMNTKFENIL